MILHGCSTTTGGVLMSSRLSKPMPRISVFASTPGLPTTDALLSIKSSWRPDQDAKSWLVKGLPPLHLSSASTPLLSGDLGGLSHTAPSVPRRTRSAVVPRASKDVP
ncbi:hypothetical protein DITRI_Ditri02bG0110100 [Diplodiscus trichospermus]